MIGFESDRDPMPENTELANWINPGSIRSYNPARQKRALTWSNKTFHTSSSSLEIEHHNTECDISDFTYLISSIFNVVKELEQQYCISIFIYERHLSS